MKSPIDDLILNDANNSIRLELTAAIDQLGAGHRYFAYDIYNVSLDGETQTATIEDELDVNRQTTVTLHEFRKALETTG